MTKQILKPKVQAIKRTDFRHQYNAGNSPGERINGISATVPDQALSISQMMARMARGIPVNAITRDAIWDGDEEMPDLSRLDKVDRMQVMREIGDDIKVAQEKLSDLEKQKAQAKKGKTVDPETTKVETIKPGNMPPAGTQEDKGGEK